METSSEGIRSEQREAIQLLSESIERNGGRVACVIAFGSRAREEASDDSDLDALILIDFESGDEDLLSDETLMRVKYNGQDSLVKSGEVGDIHLFLYNLEGFEDGLISYPDISSSELFTGIANDGVVMLGEEPFIDGRPLKEYLKQQLID